MPYRIANRVQVTVSAAPGTGTISLGSAISGFQTFAGAGVANGDTVPYLIEDGVAWELGVGTYSSTGPTLARTTIIASSNSGSAINVSANALVMVSPNQNDLNFNMPNNASATNSVDVRAPIFYDSNNTGFYFDPASTSNLNALVTNTLKISSTSDQMFTLNTPDTWAYMGFAVSDVRKAYFGLDNSNNVMIGSDVSGIVYTTGSSHFLAAGSSRSPLFYDSDNTAYYVDPASGSVLNTATFAGLHTIDVNGIAVRTGGGNYGLRIYPGGGSSATLGVLQFTNAAQNAQWGSLYFNGAEAGVGTDAAVPFYLRTNGATRLTIDGSGAAVFSVDARAPLFYDSNNTGYYVNPDGGSNLYGLTVNQTISGSVSGTAYGVALNNQVYGNNGTATDDTVSNMNSTSARSGFYLYNNPSNAPTATWQTWVNVSGHYSGDRYGWQLSHGYWDNDLWVRGVNSNSWRLWRKILDSNNYSSYSNFGGNAVYGGIFYDGNNTARYVDPNVTTLLEDCRASVFYDVYDTAYYIQGRSVSFLNDLRTNILYDRNDTGYYFDNATTRLNNLVVVGTGGKTLIQTLTASNSASLATTNCFSTAYKYYMVVFNNLLAATGNTAMYMRLYISGAYQASNYRTYTFAFNIGGSAGYAPTTYIDISGSTRNRITSGDGYVAHMIVFNPGASIKTRLQGHYNVYDWNIDGIAYGTFNAEYLTAAPCTGFQIYASSGNIASGEIQIYGWN